MRPSALNNKNRRINSSICVASGVAFEIKFLLSVPKQTDVNNLTFAYRRSTLPNASTTNSQKPHTFATVTRTSSSPRKLKDHGKPVLAIAKINKNEEKIGITVAKPP